MALRIKVYIFVALSGIFLYDIIGSVDDIDVKPPINRRYGRQGEMKSQAEKAFDGSKRSSAPRFRSTMDKNLKRSRHTGDAVMGGDTFLTSNAEVIANEMNLSSGSVLYFSGRKEILRLRQNARLQGDKRRGVKGLPYQAFSVEFWMKPEGGLPNPAPVINMIDVCSTSKQSQGWSVGIDTSDQIDGDSDPRIYFSLRTDRSLITTTIQSHQSYQPLRWVHVAVTYNGQKMKLYVGGAKVAVAHEQRGELFSPDMMSCKEVRLGGRKSGRKFFRGAVTSFRFWDTSLSHKHIVQNMQIPVLNVEQETGKKTSYDSPLLADSFINVENWKPVFKHVPIILPSDLKIHPLEILFKAPLCGQTVCDDPALVSSYHDNWQLRQLKTIRYKVLNVMNTDGLNPVVSRGQIKHQHSELIRAFYRYNITWDLEKIEIRNSSLRQKLVLFGCHPSKIGDGFCDASCQHTGTANDGGDCDDMKLPCRRGQIGDGVCDYTCNRAYHNWDGGDCCQISSNRHQPSLCYDPESPFRAYMTMSQFKEAVEVNSSTGVNVFFASGTSGLLTGMAMFPWEKEVFTIYGGAVVQPDSFGVDGGTDSLIHELGHVLGLWHVHHGVSELECDSPCLEVHPSMELGDMCSDTAPTPPNSQCHDPDHMAHEDTCRLGPFQHTPYRNYMGYADDDCADEFTPQQVARMHCYLDLIYKPWTLDVRPTPVPIAPRVLSATDEAVTIAWVPPLGDYTAMSDEGSTTPQEQVADMSICSLCEMDGSIVQYAMATAAMKAKRDRRGSAYEATGAPDAERCRISANVWLPSGHTCHNQCKLEVSFDLQITVKRLTIWVTWNAVDSLNDIVLYYTDGSVRRIGPTTTHCDIPLTIALQHDIPIKKIVLHTKSTNVGVDAVQVRSAPGQQACQKCQQYRYQLSRIPPFSKAKTPHLESTFFTDKDVIKGQSYTYLVQAVLGNRTSLESPPLIYKMSQPFCGDGYVNSEAEMCDDGNSLDGDGCNAVCQIEEAFRCQGFPSLCYRHDGDGLCEDFERYNSARDCGYFTPEGYLDQWVSFAIANPDYQLPRCPESVILGAPPISLVCGPLPNHDTSWSPCVYTPTTASYWLKVYFDKPAIPTEIHLYLASDGRGRDDALPKTLTLSIIGADNVTRLVTGGERITVNCQHNPVRIPILHDLTKTLIKMIGVEVKFQSDGIAISAVRMRSSKSFLALAGGTCAETELYNIRSGKCVPSSCSGPACGNYTAPHGHVTCTGNSEGDVCHVRCTQGHVLSTKTDELTCRSGTWVPPNKSMACVPVDCGQPVIPHATVSCQDGTNLDKTCIFKCDSHARMKGWGREVRCEADGLWSLAGAYCVAHCRTPPRHKHSQLITKSCARGAHPVGQKCKHRCHKGYHSEAHSRTKSLVHLTCDADGSWRGSRCVRIRCPNINPAFTGLYTCTVKLHAGSICTMKCPDHNMLQQSIQCQTDGQWNTSFLMCPTMNSVVCVNPSGQHSDLGIQCNGVSTGSQCNVRCAQSGLQPVIKETISLDKSVNPSYDPSLMLTCSGGGKWVPNPDQIECVQACQPAFIDDGYCDPKNNRALCLWDGGDCCPSTVTNGVVRPFPEHCTHECTCKDPKARENKQQPPENLYRTWWYEERPSKPHHRSKQSNRSPKQPVFARWP